MALTMGWSLSPPSHCVMSETICDLTNRKLRERPLRANAHRLALIAKQHDGLLTVASEPGQGTTFSLYVPASEKEVPRFADDGRTQLGTGFAELTFDGRVSRDLGRVGRVSAGAYLYRQYDSPRTDQCPPPEAPDDWCLRFDEQFRTQVVARAELEPRKASLEGLELSAGWLRQHERRTNDRAAFVNGGRDDVDVFELRALAHTRRWMVAQGWQRVLL